MGLFLYDTFHGVNGTHLAAHTPEVGGPWVDDTPGFQINGNQIIATADNCASHVEMSGSTMSLHVECNLPFVDPANFLTFSFANDVGNETLEVQIYGNGTLNVVERIAGAAQVTLNTPSGQSGVIDVSHPLSVFLSFGPDLCTVRIGSLCYSYRRIHAKSFSFTRFRLSTGALNGAFSPEVQSLEWGN